MKKLLALALIASLASCGNQESANSNSNNTENKVVADFLRNPKTLEKIEDGNPIVQFQEAAQDVASESFTLTKNNIEDLLETAKEFEHCVITAGDHTIVMITDFDDCKPSGSWGACMPMAEGYIKKGDLEPQEDYINNIIGTPDGQERTVYLFN